MQSKNVSSIFGKYAERAKKIHEEVKGKEVKQSNNMDLPYGIPNGVAKLVDCRISEYKTGDLMGEPLFIARGVVVSPDEHNGVYIKGLSTLITEPLCDTPQRKRATFEDHYDFVVNELKKLDITGGDRFEDITAEDLPELMSLLVEEGPHFQFRTSEKNPQKPDQKPYHNWIRLVEWHEESPTPPKETKEAKEEIDYTEEEEEEFKSDFTEGAIVTYKPAKGKKRVLCQITSCYDDGTTYDLANLHTKQEYVGVDESELELHQDAEDED